MNIHLSNDEADYLLSLLEKQSNKSDWEVEAYNIGVRIRKAKETND